MHGRRKFFLPIKEAFVYQIVLLVLFPLVGTLLAGEVSISVSPERIRLGSVSVQDTPCPISPYVFFEPGSSRLPVRFFDRLELFVGRIFENPFLTLRLYGYYSPDVEPVFSISEGRALAVARANAVNDFLREKRFSLKSSVIESGYDFGHQPFLGDENCRVELVPTLVQFNPRVIYASEKRGKWRANADAVIESALDEIREILCSNPDVDILLTGYNLDTNTVFSLKMVNKIYKKLCKGLGKKLSNRIKVSVIRSGNTRDRKIEISPCTDRILFHPNREPVVKRAEIIDTSVTFRLKKKNNLRRVSASIEDTNGRFIINLYEGDTLPEAVSWNLRDYKGALVDPREEYRLRLRYLSPDSQLATISSSTVSFSFRGVLSEEERTVAGLWKPGEYIASSNIIKTGCFEVAKKLYDGSRVKGMRQIVTIEGSQSDEEPDKLWRKRADGFVECVRNYLMFFSGKEDPLEFDSWLISKGITFEVSQAIPSACFEPDSPEKSVLSRCVYIHLQRETTR